MNMTNIQELLNNPTLVSKIMTALFGYYDENHPLSEDQKKGLEYVLWRRGTPSPDDLSIRKWANSARYPYIMRIILKGYSELSDREKDDLWKGMKARCNCPSQKCYKYYGGKGVKVCEQWSEDFDSFHQWAINNGYSGELTIDRIDSDMDYEPSNCRWVSMTVQNRNKKGVRENG